MNRNTVLLLRVSTCEASKLRTQVECLTKLGNLLNQKLTIMTKQRTATSSRRDDVIRSRLLYSLGIQKPSLYNSHRSETNTHTIAILPRRPASINLLSAGKATRISLNDSRNHKWDQTFTMERRKSNRRKRMVRFNSDVMSKPIASQKKYSNRIKSRLWNTEEEIENNAYRNLMEYTYEGWEWENAVEDAMYIDANRGQWAENER